VQTIRLRLQIAKLQLEGGDIRGAAAEIHAAQLTANELGSPKLTANCAELQTQLDARNVTQAVAGARR
jgi:HPt (histidine-containing phosphotransfer) domain-containing protein